MKYRGIFEYEYPTEHKPPVSIDVYLHGDCVKGKIIEWEYRPLEQEPMLGKLRAEILRQEKWLMDAGYNQYNVDIALDAIKLVIDKYNEESEE